MYNGFRKKKSTNNQNFDKLIQELKEENASRNKELKEILDNLYEKNKKDNEVKGAFDLILKIAIIAVFAFATFAFIGMIVYMWKSAVDTIPNMIIYSVDIGLIIFMLIMMIIQLWKEKNRNYIISCVTVIIALIALFVALSKQGQ